MEQELEFVRGIGFRVRSWTVFLTWQRARSGVQKELNNLNDESPSRKSCNPITGGDGFADQGETGLTCGSDGGPS